MGHVTNMAGLVMVVAAPGQRFLSTFRSEWVSRIPTLIPTLHGSVFPRVFSERVGSSSGPFRTVFFFFFFYEFMHIWPGGKPWIHFGTGPTFLVYYFRFTDYDYSKFQNMGRCLYHNEQLAVSNSELNVGGDGAYLSNVLSLEPEGDVVYPGGSMPILNTTTVAVASCSSLCEGSIMLKCWWGFWYYTFIRMQQLE